ncbi:Mitochondrial chaperone BCS1-like protein [Hibiscus syriacus]|uniref:Mitochondrial chaperone BCS1-like protein n=1 Tax=Hibiscus syriacus TaxID=106335 RepID=A0A6A3DAD3_HIBSY|nr:Mitochondrial chaperone BCS1-like protein [Hibiscus syriacus]
MWDGQEPSFRSRRSVSQHQDQPQVGAAQGQNPHSGEKRHFELSFNKKHKDKVLDFYLPNVLLKAEETKNKDKAIKIYRRQCTFSEDDGETTGFLGSIILDHPATFDTLATNPDLKKMIIDDLDRFLKTKGYYKKVGKGWKRGVRSDADLRRTLLSTGNRFILLIEEIDCISGVLERKTANQNKQQDAKSGNGAWSAEVAEELMRSDDADTALQGLVEFLKRKREEANETEDKPADCDEVGSSVRRLNAAISRVKRSKTDGDRKKIKMMKEEFKPLQ